MPLVLDHESEPNNNLCETTMDTMNNERESFEDLDLPIAIRKGKRSCTKHPISNYVSHSKLCSSFKVLTKNIEKTEIQRNIQEAIKIHEWGATVYEEMKALQKNETWDVVDLPKGKIPVGCK